MVKYYDPIIEDARAGKRVHLDNVVVIPYSMRDLEARYVYLNHLGFVKSLGEEKRRKESVLSLINQGCK